MDSIREVELTGNHAEALAVLRERMAELLDLMQPSKSYARSVAYGFRHFARWYGGGPFGPAFQSWVSSRARCGVQASTLKLTVDSLGVLMSDADPASFSGGIIRRLRRRIGRSFVSAPATSDEQLERLLQWTGSAQSAPEVRLQQRVLMLLLARTGLRLCEALSLRPVDVDVVSMHHDGLRRDAVVVRYQVAKQRSECPGLTWVPLKDGEKNLWRELLAMRPDLFGPIFQIGGTPLSSRRVQKWFESVRRPGETGMTARALRHRVARLVQKHMGEWATELVLGHRMGATSGYLDPPDLWPYLAPIVYDETAGNLDGRNRHRQQERRDRRRRRGGDLRPAADRNKAAGAGRLPERRNEAGHGPER